MRNLIDQIGPWLQRLPHGIHTLDLYEAQVCKEEGNKQPCTTFLIPPVESDGKRDGFVLEVVEFLEAFTLNGQSKYNFDFVARGAGEMVRRYTLRTVAGTESAAPPVKRFGEGESETLVGRLLQQIEKKDERESQGFEAANKALVTSLEHYSKLYAASVVEMEKLHREVMDLRAKVQAATLEKDRYEEDARILAVELDKVQKKNTEIGAVWKDVQGQFIREAGVPGLLKLMEFAATAIGVEPKGMIEAVTTAVNDAKANGVKPS